MKSYNREELLSICERAFVPETQWSNRDSANTQRQLGECYALLQAGCEFNVLHYGALATNNRTIWVEIFYRGFSSFEYGSDHTDSETFYLPTVARLDKSVGRDWY